MRDEEAIGVKSVERSPVEIGLEKVLRNSKLLHDRLHGVLRPNPEGANQDKPEEAPVISSINDIDDILEDILDRLVV